MYSPKYAIETDRNKIDSVINENSFATLVYSESGNIQSFHLPLFLKGDKLIGHMAKANLAWQVMDSSSLLVIFMGLIATFHQTTMVSLEMFQLGITFQFKFVAMSKLILI